MISDDVVDALVLDLQDAFAGVPDEETAGVIRGGKLQANPVKARISVLVHIGDPEKPDAWIDTLASMTQSNSPGRISLDIPAYEVGGGSMWRRRFTVEFGVYLTKSKEDRDEARALANLTRGRIERAVSRSTRVPRLTDDFGETAMLVAVTASKITEGGGPPTSFIWRGVVYVEVATARAY